MKPTPQQVVAAIKNTHAANCECCKKKPGAVAGQEYIEALRRLYRNPVPAAPQPAGGEDER